MPTKTNAYRAALGLAAICCALAAPGLSATFLANAGDDPTVTEVEEAGKLFSKSCAACHLPPDLDHVTDRAWLSQVTDTA